MSPNHLGGATIGALIGFVASNFGWGVGQDEALAIGAAAAAVSTGIVHLAVGPGLLPALRRAIFGPKAPPAA